MLRLIAGTALAVLLALAAIPRPPPPVSAADLRRLLDASEVVTAPAGPNRLYALPWDGPLGHHAALVEAGAPPKILDVLRYEKDAWTDAVYAASADLAGDGRPEVVIWRYGGIQWHIDVHFFGVEGDRLTLLAHAGLGDFEAEVTKDPETGRDLVEVPTNVWSALGYRFGQSVRVFGWREGRLAVVREYRRLPLDPWADDGAAAEAWDDCWTPCSNAERALLLDHWKAVTGVSARSREDVLGTWSENRNRHRAGAWFVFPAPRD